MIPIRIAGHTHSWGKPLDWDEEKLGPCATLYARQVQYEETGARGFESAWQPTQEELLAILQGGTIYLRIMMPQHPVVSLWAEAAPPEDTDPYGAPPPAAA